MCVIGTVSLFCMILVTAGNKMLSLKKKNPEIFLEVFNFQNGSLFCFPRCASKFYKLQTVALCCVSRALRLPAANRL